MHNFRKACIGTTALLLCIAAMFTLLTAPYFAGTYYYYQDGALREELSGQIDTLVCGASYANWGIDTRVLDQELGCNAYNLASCLQTMKGRYYLLKQELERNPVKTVILEVSAFSLTRSRTEEGPEGDIYVLGRMNSLKERLDYFFYSISPEEYSEVLYDTMHRGIFAWKQLVLGNPSALDASAKGFHGYPSANLDIYKSQLETFSTKEPVPLERDPESVEYFEKCLELCREYGVRVVLISTPVSGRNVLQTEGFDTVYAWYQDYAERCGVEFYDFNLLWNRRWRLHDYDSFMDLQHLSDVGAIRFTELLSEVLLCAENGEDVSGFFLENYAAVEKDYLDNLVE